MIICICNRVSDRELVQNARAGKDFDTIQFETGVATRCGQCETCARHVVATGCMGPSQLAQSQSQGARHFLGVPIRANEWAMSLGQAQA